ncbi:DUF4921 family protein [Rhodopirellula sp.]|nr:DUF4921 family protein [Rhodopirellula sp.]
MPERHTPPRSFSRLNPITGNWILFSPGRDRRPTDFSNELIAPNQLVSCPFCVGRESDTPPSVWIGKHEGSSLTYGNTQKNLSFETDLDWSVRVFENKYPAVSMIQSSESEIENPLALQQMQTVGAHEITVDSRNHTQLMKETSPEETRLLFRALQERISFWHEHDGVQYVSAFKNCGAAAGASLIHSHCQLIATNYVPSSIQNNINRMQNFFDSFGQCLLCNLNNQELRDETRLVHQGKSVIAYCPYASDFPMQIRISPLSHKPYFHGASNQLLDECALLTRHLIMTLQRMIAEVSYNLIISTLPPNRNDHEQAFHWSIDICPRISGYAGFEIATQNNINCIMPEEAAEGYRSELSADYRP